MAPRKGYEFKLRADVNEFSYGDLVIGSAGLKGNDPGLYMALLPHTQGDDAALTVTGKPSDEGGEVVKSENYNAVAGSTEESYEEIGPTAGPVTDEAKEG